MKSAMSLQPPPSDRGSTAAWQDPPRAALSVLARRPFRADVLTWRTSSNGLMLTLAVKVSYVLREGTCTISPDADPINDRDRFVANDESRSLASTNDLVPMK